MQDTINQAKTDFLRAKESLTRAFGTTPDDRINWSPASTARTPIHLVAHAAQALKAINSMLDGRRFEFDTTAKADRAFLEWEQQFCTRQQVLGLLDKYSAEYVAWLDALTPERLESMIELPFGLGSAPLAAGLTFAPGHLSGHAAQIEYIQTIYGDRDWHL